MKVRYTPTANAELGEVLDYIAERSAQGVHKVQERIGDMVSLLSRFPYAGSLTDDPGLRCIIASPYPYLIFYEVNDAEDEVVVIAVRHSARDPSTMPGSLPL